jgi:hypothetical protein
MNYELDLFISATHNRCMLRITSTFKFFRIIQPKLPSNAKIVKVKLSQKGYIIIQYHTSSSDVFLTYTYFMKFPYVYFRINGELVCENNANEFINEFIFDQTGYYIVCSTSQI